VNPEISERSFEEAIECALLENGPDACAGDAMTVREALAPYGDGAPGGYRKRRPQDYDRGLCLLPRDVVDFILATQPKEWEKLRQHYGAEVKERFLARLSREIGRRAALDVLRNGVKDSGCAFRLAFFRPASGLNEALQRLHAANLFAVVRQLRYSEKDGKSLDLVLFLNGIPIFTAELKNPLNAQTVEDAIRQYKIDRDPREPLLVRPLPGSLRRGSGAGVRHHAPCGAEDGFPPAQPGAFRRGREPAGPADAEGLCHALPLGGHLGSRQRARPHPPVHPRGRGGR
jgi:type I restriction enzyme R subunit